MHEKGKLFIRSLIIGGLLVSSAPYLAAMDGPDVVELEALVNIYEPVALIIPCTWRWLPVQPATITRPANLPRMKNVCDAIKRAARQTRSRAEDAILKIAAGLRMCTGVNGC